MTEVQDGERILGEHIYELAAHGLIAEETAEAWNEELQDLVTRIENAYEPEEHDG